MSILLSKTYHYSSIVPHNREVNSDPPKPETLAFETALRNELLGESISEISVRELDKSPQQYPLY